MPTDDSERVSHNIDTDENLAAAGRCGALHLPSGRACILPARHPGGCHFEPRPKESGADEPQPGESAAGEP